MEMTVKELADELGITKQKLMYHAKKLNKNQYAIKEGVFHLNDLGIKALKEKFGTQNSEKNTKNNGENHIEIITNQLKQKDEQLEKMQKLLDQQQQLHLQANQRIEMLEKQLSLEEPKTQSQGEVVSKEELEKLEENRQELLKSIDFQSKEINALHEARKEDEIINEELFNELKRLTDKKWFQFWKYKD